MKRIFVVGDTHGILDAKKLNKLADKYNLDYEDYIIICGDCGVVWSETTFKAYTAFYENLHTNILFVDGNHENFDMLNEYAVSNWNGGKVHKITEHIMHLMRGQIFNILGKTFLALGGAESTDRERRVEHISWWRDEAITQNDIRDTKTNLGKVDYKVDYVITHTPSTKTLNNLVEILTQCGEEVPYFLQKKVVPTNSSDKLDFIHNEVKFNNWFCGHLHIDERIENVNILYSGFVKIDC